MAKFISVTNTKGETKCINIEHIIYIEPYKSDSGKMITQIFMTPRFTTNDNYVIADVDFQTLKTEMEKI